MINFDRTQIILEHIHEEIGRYSDKLEIGD